MTETRVPAGTPAHGSELATPWLTYRFQLLVGQLTQGWQVKVANPSAFLRTGLRPLVDKAGAIIQTLDCCDSSAVLGTGLVKVRRDEPVVCQS